MTKTSATTLRQQDKKFAHLRKFANEAAHARPETGWLKALRHAMGMSIHVLGNRLGKSGVSVHLLEASERKGTITLNTLRKAANALDADLVYAIVPRHSLSETLRARARVVATARTRTVARTMALENQELTPGQQRRQIESSVDELITRPKDLWR